MKKIIITFEQNKKILEDHPNNYEKVIMPDRETIKTFGRGDISKMCNCKIGGYKLEMREVDEELMIFEKKKANEFDKEILAFYKLKIQLLEMIKEDLQKKIDKWRNVRKRLYLKRSKKKEGDREEFDIEAIKQIPIGDIIDDEPTYQSSTRAKYRCPIHEEKTASFVVYRDSNTWYCFGACATGGDVISLYEKLHNCDFLTACGELSKNL